MNAIKRYLSVLVAIPLIAFTLVAAKAEPVKAMTFSNENLTDLIVLDSLYGSNWGWNNNYLAGLIVLDELFK